MEIILSVDWVSVVVGAVVAFLVGWLWYSPKLFGIKWAEGVGININDGSGPKASAMIAQIVGTFLLSWVIGVSAALNSLALAVLVALMASTLIKANGLFAQKSKYAIIVESGFVLVMVIVMVIVHAII